MGKRKRKRHSGHYIVASKKQKSAQTSEEVIPPARTVTHGVLSSYYVQLFTLRDYVCSRLALISKRRLRTIYKLRPRQQVRSDETLKNPKWSARDYDKEVASLLDNVLVGFRTIEDSNQQVVDRIERSKEYQTFSQHLLASGSTSKSQLGGQGVSFSEVIDFAIWYLFNHRYASYQKPPHSLCGGLVRASSTWQNRETNDECTIPGLVCLQRNEHIKSLKGSAWARLFALLGHSADHIMIHLITNSALFMPMGTASKSYYQLSGHFVSDLKPLTAPTVTPMTIVPSGENSIPAKERLPQARSCLHKTSEIRFVRSRILYARAALNARGEVAFGLRHIHVFNRFPDPLNINNTIHIMKYIFPRQFGLHNVFTSKADPRETIQPFQDYTLRELEIAKMRLTRKLQAATRPGLRNSHELPRRLKGPVLRMVQDLQRRHSRCSYTKLLAHYCPAPVASDASSNSQIFRDRMEQYGFKSFVTPVAQVSAFCRAIVARVFPAYMLGGIDNEKIIHNDITDFLECRRFESITLEVVLRRIKVKNIAWLNNASIATDKPLALSDFLKRLEILSEFVYYIFDSFLVPLVRTNFHVTESTTNRNRLLYVRHDVWRRICEPTLNKLKNSMFEVAAGPRYVQPQKGGDLGYSQLRLMPKEKGLRPILNLSRRVPTKRGGTKMMGRSINSLLSPAFHALKFEKLNQGGRLGSSMFSVSDMYSRIGAFREKLKEKGQFGRKLFFVKVDVKECFDSIPQEKMIELVHRLLSAREYTVAHFTEFKQARTFRVGAGTSVSKPSKKFAACGYAGQPLESLADLIAYKAGVRAEQPNTVYIDSAASQIFSRAQILKMVEEHVRCNTVKIGKRFYHQKRGIPQGSILSTLLCNFFYGDMERCCLRFLNAQESELFRLIDDFLLITTEFEQAKQFLDAMQAGISSHGVIIKREKSLVNFDVSMSGQCVPKVGASDTKFPYCGVLIDHHTLDVNKDDSNLRGPGFVDSVTVERCRSSGIAFQRKILNALKIQMTPMLLDTNQNSRSTVLKNLFRISKEAAFKSYIYMRCLGRNHQPSLSTLDRLVAGIQESAFAMMRSRKHRLTRHNYQCAISKNATRWLVLRAFLRVFQAKQSAFGQFVATLETSLATWSSLRTFELAELEQVSAS